jgi:hypothetical protein
MGSSHPTLPTDAEVNRRGKLVSEQAANQFRKTDGFVFLPIARTHVGY